MSFNTKGRTAVQTGIEEKTLPTVHNYTHRTWGHDVSYQPTDKSGLSATVNGWGHGLKPGDYLLMKFSGNPVTRYRLTEVIYMSNPTDQWFGKAVFAPRSQEEMEVDKKHLDKISLSWKLGQDSLTGPVKSQ